MNTGCRCGARSTAAPEATDSDGLSRPARVHRRLVITGWLVPTAILAFLPKCPVCFALYIAIATGLELSTPTATYLREFLLILCAAALLYLAYRQWPALAKFIPYMAVTRHAKSL